MAGSWMRSPLLQCEALEARETPALLVDLTGSGLAITGSAENDRIRVYRDGPDLVVLEGTQEAGRFASNSVTSVIVEGGAGNDTIVIENALTQSVVLDGGDGKNKLSAGGGVTVLTGGAGEDALFGGLGENTFNGGPGQNDLFRVLPADIVIPNPGDRTLPEAELNTAVVVETLSTDEVSALLQRAAAASASTDAIIVVTDQNGTILGVRVESGVDPAITSNSATLAFAVDGAVSLARTGAFFANDQGPLTSRTVQFISQSTITEREVNSNPNITDPNSTVRGPGFIAPVGVGGHFPPGIANTPQVDLFAIEHSNRDSTFAVGADRIRGTADDVELSMRFNIDPAFVPAGQELTTPDSYGLVSGLAPLTANGIPIAQNRGIATLPGGVPIFKNGQVVGGIGVFFPGKSGYASEENSSLSTTYDPTKPDRTLEAEWIAYAAVGGTVLSIGGVPIAPVGELGGVPVPAGFGLPAGRIDLVGITLDIFGPGGPQQGLKTLLQVGQAVGRGNANDGVNLPVTTGGTTLLAGQPVPDGWLVTPHDGDGITKADVERIVTQSIIQSNLTRAAIRLPLGTRAKFVFAIADRQGNLLGLYREPGATVFSIDVAVAKARNVAYYADANELQPVDQIAGVPGGTAFSSRTFRYVAEPRFPEGIDGLPPGPFSQLNDGGANVFTGQQVGPPLPASAYQSVFGYDAFNPGTNFRDPFNTLNQNGIIFFPGSAPVYKVQKPGEFAVLSGGFGVSGDGVDQDDVTTVAGQVGFNVPVYVLRADQVFVQGVRLPYQKFNRNPEG